MALVLQSGHHRESQNLTLPTILCPKIQCGYNTSRAVSAEGEIFVDYSVSCTKGIRKRRFYKNVLWTTDFAHLNNYITECCLLLFDPQTWTQNHVFEIWFCCDLKHLHKARPTKRETTLTPDLLSFLNVSVKFYLNHL